MDTGLLVWLFALATLLIASAAFVVFLFAQKRGFAPRKKWLAVGITAGALTIAAIIVAAIFLPSALANAHTPDKMDPEQEKRCQTIKSAVIWSVIVLFVVLAVIVTLVFRGKESKTKYFTAKNIARLASFTALSYILYLFAPFKLPFMFPEFLEMQISDMPALFAGFMMGPPAGMIVIVLKVVLKLPFSTTAGVGELGDLILGISFVLPASLIYMFIRKKKGAVISLISGSLICVATALVINRYLLVPFYVQYYFGGNWGPILGTVAPLYGEVTKETFYTFYLWLAVLPFNIIRCATSALVTYFIYKHLGKAFDKMFEKHNVPLEQPPVEESFPPPTEESVSSTEDFAEMRNK